MGRGDWEMGRKGMREKRRERQTEGEKSKPTERKHSFTQSFLVWSIHETRIQTCYNRKWLDSKYTFGPLQRRHALTFRFKHAKHSYFANY